MRVPSSTTHCVENVSHITTARAENVQRVGTRKLFGLLILQYSQIQRWRQAPETDGTNTLDILEIARQLVLFLEVQEKTPAGREFSSHSFSDFILKVFGSTVTTALFCRALWTV